MQAGSCNGVEAVSLIFTGQGSMVVSNAHLRSPIYEQFLFSDQAVWHVEALCVCPPTLCPFCLRLKYSPLGLGNTKLMKK